MSLRLITRSHSCIHSVPQIQGCEFDESAAGDTAAPHSARDGADDGGVPPQFAWTEGADGHRRSRKLIGVAAPVSGEVRGGSCFKGEGDQCS